MTFAVIPASEVPTSTTRISKTTPLRNAMLELAIGEAIEVVYDSVDPVDGYRPTTVNQVAGTMSRRSETVKFSVRKKTDGTGCYIIAGPKPAPGEAKRGRKAAAKPAA
jgi:hypothetical protein